MFTLSIVPKHIRDFKPHTFLYWVKSLFKNLWEEIKSIPSAFASFFSTGNVIRMIPLILMMFCFSFDGMAQTAAGGFASATTTIQGYQVQVSNLMKAIGAVIAIVGAFNVFFKMQNGDQDVKKTIMLTIGGCIAFVALGEALPMFFE